MKIQFSSLSKATKDLKVLVIIIQFIALIVSYLKNSLGYLKGILIFQLFLLIVLAIIQKYSNKYGFLFDNLIGKANNFIGEDK